MLSLVELSTGSCCRWWNCLQVHVVVGGTVYWFMLSLVELSTGSCCRWWNCLLVYVVVGGAFAIEGLVDGWMDELLLLLQSKNIILYIIIYLLK